MPDMEKIYTLIGSDGKLSLSSVPGAFGGHRGGKLYGRLDCRAALQAIARGGYVKHRVFFLSEATAVAAGYRPCAVCMPEGYAIWKKNQLVKTPSGADVPLQQARRLDNRR